MEKRIFVLEGILANKVTVETLALALQRLYNGEDTGLGLSVEEVTGKKIKYMEIIGIDQTNRIPEYKEVIPKEEYIINLIG